MWRGQFSSLIPFASHSARNATASRFTSVSHIEDQLLPRRFDDEQLPELLDIVRLDPAAESEHYLTVRRSPDSEHNHACVNCREGQSDAQA